MIDFDAGKCNGGRDAHIIADDGKQAVARRRQHPSIATSVGSNAECEWRFPGVLKLEVEC